MPEAQKTTVIVDTNEKEVSAFPGIMRLLMRKTKHFVMTYFVFSFDM